MAQASAYGAAYNRLELDGTDAGPLHSVEGGEPYGEVVQVAGGAGSVTGKRIGAVHYADIAIECGLVQSGPLADWISATLGGTLLRRGGAVVEYDREYRETSRLAFRDAAIHEVKFPALDASRRDPAHLTVRLAPEWTQRQAGSGAVQPKDSGMIRRAGTKQPRSCDFRLHIDGLEAKQVSEIGPLLVQQAIGEPTVGEVRLAEAPRWLDIQDLVVTLPEAADWYAWRDAFIVGGTGPERSGRLELLSPDSGNVLARIEFSGLGIHSLVRERSEEAPRAIRRVRTSMYCGNVSFGPLVAPPPATAAPEAAPTMLLRRSRVDVTVPLAAERALARPGFV